MATIICKEHRPQMSTVRPGVMRTKPKDEQRAGTVEKVNIHFDKSKFKVRILETVKEQKNRIDITEAKILVSGGRGVGNTEGFEMLGKLAETLNAEVSSSRAMVGMPGLCLMTVRMAKPGKPFVPICISLWVFPELFSIWPEWRNRNLSLP